MLTMADAESGDRSQALLTDLYQLTMAQGYWAQGHWESGTKGREAVFHLFFRQHPFQGGFTIAAGLQPAIEFVRGLRYHDSDLAYLETIRGNDGQPLFERAFLDALRALEFRCDLDAVPEGTAVFPREPIVRVRGPLPQCQLLETPLLTIINFQTLIATKSARVFLAAAGDPVMEFGLRRAQGTDGGLAASRAAFIGGCSATSNVLAGKRYGVPVKGTHAHSWVMSFESEAESFDACARAMPNNCIFLVDTYDTIEGVKNAIEASKKLARQGHRVAGIRLDSGDLVTLSIAARDLLDQAGFPGAAIVGSGDLDEHRIADLKSRGCKIGVWGVGTRLATGHPDGSLGGVYKLAAIRDANGGWNHKLKLSGDPVKRTLPGIQQVRRFSSGDRYIADVIFNETSPPDGDWVSFALGGPGQESGQKRTFGREAEAKNLLAPMLRAGDLVDDCPALDQVRQHTLDELERLADPVKRLVDPEVYHVGIESGLRGLEQDLIRRVRGPAPR